MLFLLVFNLILIVGLAAHIARLYAERSELRSDLAERDRLINFLHNELEKR